MKKFIAIAVVLVLAAAIFTVSSMAADSNVVEVSVAGVPTLLLPSEGAQVVDEVDGQKTVIALAPGENIDFTSTDDFDKDQTVVYDDMLATEDKRDICDNFEEVLHSVDPAGDAREYTEWDTFDFGMSGEVAALFRENEGRYVELTFKCDVFKDEPIMLMVYYNGEWTALEDLQYDVEDGLLIVRLNHEGIVTILCKRTGAVTSSVVRASVQFKPVPELVDVAEDNMFSMWDDRHNNKVVWNIPANEIVLTSADSLEGDSKIAYLNLAETESISKLCPTFMDIAKTIDSAIKEEELVIKDVFEFRLSGDSEKSLDAEDDNNVVLNFKYDIHEGDFFMVLEFIDGQWVPLDADFYWTAENQIGVRLCDDGLIAFIVKAE